MEELGVLVHFYMHGHTELIKLDSRLSIHAFELEIWPPEVFLYICTGKSYMCICNDLCN